MSKAYIVSVILFLTMRSAFAQWGTQSSGISEPLRSVFFATPDQGWTISQHSVLKTSDGGAYWVPVYQDGARTFSDIAFANSATGLLVGFSGLILQTTNGGTSWNPQVSNTNAALYYVKFSTSDIGWVAGRGIFLKTTDGGSTWMQKTPTGFISGGVFPPNFFFLDSLNGWLLDGFRKLYKTTDGAETWQATEFAPSGWAFATVFFADPNVGWLGGGSGIVGPQYSRFEKTTDGGNTWVQLTTPTNQPIMTFQFANEQRGWIPTINGYILSTTNGGSGWYQQYHSVQSIQSIFFLNQTLGWAVGYGGLILKTENGGGPLLLYPQWSSQNAQTTINLSEVRFLNADVGWAAGEGYVLRTTNGGMNWAFLHQPQNATKGIAVLNANTAVVVGNNGYISKTTDAGVTWTTRQSGTNSWFEDVFFLDENIGWAVGNPNTPNNNAGVSKTADGGVSWSPQNSGYLYGTLNSIFFSDSLHGCAVGEAGNIRVTSNGGATWSPVSSGTSGRLFGVHLSNQNNGWIVGQNGIILKTSNGGMTWTPKNSNSAAWLWALSFVDENIGWAVGEAGTILHTVDGGESWVPEATTFGQTLFSVHFIDQNTGWAVGAGGTIRKRSLISSIDEGYTPTLPSDYILFQNYPNPFNPTTKIKFQIAQSGFVSLKVFDLLGREVATLVNEEMRAGSYERTFHAEGLASGIYFYHLTAGTFSQTKKLVLLR